jgi:hypothetical protein
MKTRIAGAIVLLMFTMTASTHAFDEDGDRHDQYERNKLSYEGNSYANPSYDRCRPDFSSARMIWTGTKWVLNKAGYAVRLATKYASTLINRTNWWR